MIHCQESFGTFVTLGGLPPRWLAVARELPSFVVSCEKFVAGFASPPQGKKLNSGSEERVERDPTRVGAS